MTKEEAIDIIKCLAWHTRPNEEDIEQAIKVLKQEPYEDCVSRQEVRKTLEDRFIELQKRHSADRYETNFCLNTILELPSVTPKQKIGHWRDTGSGQECSICGEIQYGYDTFRHFCANCGARMEAEK